MKIRNKAISALLSGLILTLILSTGLTAPQRQPAPKAEESKVVIIPKEVKTVLEEGMASRQARTDIPFTIVRHLYFPAGPAFHSIFIFEVKNEDLGYAPIAPAPEKKEEELTAFVTASSRLQTKSHIFLQFNRLEGDTPAEVVQEVYVPVNIQEEETRYDPEKMEFYSAGYPLAPGNYLLSMAVTSQKLEKIGTQYYEFSLPDYTAFIDKLDTTPIFFAERIEYIDEPERRPKAHKNLFTYSIINVEPNLERIFSSGDNIELFFYIFGAQPDDNGQFQIEVIYDVLKGEEKAILFAPANYESPLVQQQLPLQKTVLIKSETEERTEKRDIEPGPYRLAMKITDKISGKSVTKSLDFVVE